LAPRPRREINEPQDTDDTRRPIVTDRSEERLTLSVDEAARLLGISSGLVYGLVHRGELAAIRLGRRILVPRHAVEALVGRPDNVA
jgi:excisionase family DNA binding protein